MWREVISKTARDYVERTGFRFSDKEIATVVYQSDLSLLEKQKRLRQLRDSTADAELRREIDEHFAYHELCLARFAANDGSCFFQVTHKGEPKGNFASLALAVEHGRGTGKEFAVDKYQIVGLCKEIIKLHWRSNPRLGMDFKEVDFPYDGDSIGDATYSAAGKLESVYTEEVTDEEWNRVHDWGERRFEERFFEMPNPFEAGAAVETMDGSIRGIVTTTREEWEADLRRIAEHNLPVDFVDTTLRVQVSTDKQDHGHIPPIFLEKIEGPFTLPQGDTAE